MFCCNLSPGKAYPAKQKFRKFKKLLFKTKGLEKKKTRESIQKVNNKNCNKVRIKLQVFNTIVYLKKYGFKEKRI